MAEEKPVRRTKYVALQALSMTHPGNPKRSLLIKAGQVASLTDEEAKRCLRRGIIRELTDEERGDEEPVTGALVGDPHPGETGPVDVVEWPARPSNGAAKDAWLQYIDELEDAVDEEIEVPEDAKRDDLIRIADDFRAKHGG